MIILVFLICLTAGALGGDISALLHKKLTAEQTDRLFIVLMIIIFMICIFNTARMLS